MTERTGRCLCGAVTFSARAVPGGYGVCHCEMCRRWAGSALFGVSLSPDDVAWSGLEHIGRFASSGWAERAWCTRCGSGLWYRAKGDAPGAGVFEVPLGLFDHTEGLALEREIFVDCRASGVDLQGEHARLSRADTLRLYGVDPG